MSNDSEINHILYKLSSERGLVSLSRAKFCVPSTAGFYAIYIDSTESLPTPFKKELEERNKDYKFNNLLYLGKANQTEKRNLKIRLVNEALMGGTHTFFRGLGAILNCKPPFGSLRDKKNQENYCFDKDDKMRIIEFIEQHIHVRWCKSSVSTKCLNDLEGKLIKRLKPLMNSSKNPWPSPLLRDLRDECRTMARGDCA